MKKTVDLETLGFITFLKEFSECLTEEDVLTKKFIADAVGWTEQKVSDTLDDLVAKGFFIAEKVEDY